VNEPTAQAGVGVFRLLELAVALVIDEEIGTAVRWRDAHHEELALHPVFLDGVLAILAERDLGLQRRVALDERRGRRLLERLRAGRDGAGRGLRGCRGREDEGDDGERKAHVFHRKDRNQFSNSPSG